MWRWLVRYGAIRVVGRRALPVLMVWDAAVMANRVRQVPVVDRAIRRGAAAAAERLADTLDGLTPQVGRTGAKRSSDDEPSRGHGSR
jgi:hypothetical protein